MDIELVVENTGGFWSEIELSILNDDVCNSDGLDASLSQYQFSLNGGDTDEVDFSIDSPEDNPPGSFCFIILASVGDEETIYNQTFFNITLIIPEIKNCDIEIFPQNGMIVFSANEEWGHNYNNWSQDISITNTGNVEYLGEFYIESSDEEFNVEFLIDNLSDTSFEVGVPVPVNFSIDLYTLTEESNYAGIDEIIDLVIGLRSVNINSNKYCEVFHALTINTDSDGDYILDFFDIFPDNSFEWSDYDKDGIGDNADTDDDNDGILDREDSFPLDSRETIDTDNDGIGDNADTDDDNDGWSDEDENSCNSSSINLTSIPLDTDGDSICDILDVDDDNDLTNDEDDAFPLNNKESIDTDGDGVGNNEDTDDDGDLVTDVNDFCPQGEIGWTSGAAIGTDLDGDGCRDAGEDLDDDGDGVSDTQDSCPLGQTGWISNSVNDNDGDGCQDNGEDLDDDGDGVNDNEDDYPNDPNKWSDIEADGNGDDSNGGGIIDNIDESEDSGLPGFGLILTLISMISATIVISKRRR